MFCNHNIKGVLELDYHPSLYPWIRNTCIHTYMINIDYSIGCVKWMSLHPYIQVWKYKLCIYQVLFDMMEPELP